MFAFLKKFFSPPIFRQDEEKTRSAAILNLILLGTIVLLSLLVIQELVSATTQIALVCLDFAAIGLWFLVKQGYVRQAGYIFVSFGWIGLTIQAWTYSGLRDIAIVAYIVIILAAGLLVNLRTSFVFATLSLIASWAFAYLETIKKYNGLGTSPYHTAIDLTIVFLLVALVSYITINDINRALKKSRLSEQELRANNQELQTLRADLEKRVSERTIDLERRNLEIQTASLIARDTALAADIDSLLDRAAQLIKDKFGYYHTGIYLIDDNGEYAALRAAGGDAGQLMLKRKYKVRVGEAGIIGYVAQAGISRIILDVATEDTYFKNPLLPYTRSEMTLPLKVTNRILGVLDIQSDKINAFDQNSISIMQVVTDQISISIERVQLHQGLQQNTVALQQALQENTSRTWRNFLEQNRGNVGYRYDGVTVESLLELPADSITSVEENEPANSPRSEGAKPGNIVAVPIRLRGQTLGTLNLRFQTNEVSQETLQLVEEAANRLALALENARLVQDAQRLAMRERQINIISAQAQQSTNLETLLQNTVRELGNTLGMPKTFIQIGLVQSGPEKNQ
ncbi:MAG: GAF domain-containing protein [Anaerolineales bacterium]